MPTAHGRPPWSPARPSTLVRWTLDELAVRIVNELLGVNGATVIVAAPSPASARGVFDAACREASVRGLGASFTTRAGTCELLVGNRVARFVSGQAARFGGLRPTLAIVFRPSAHRNVAELAMRLGYACLTCGGEYHEVEESRGGRRGRL